MVAFFHLNISTNMAVIIYAANEYRPFVSLPDSYTNRRHPMHRRPSLVVKIFAIVILLGCTSAQVIYAQGKPDLVWMRGGHTSAIGSVAYSPDGKWAVSLAETGKLWRLSDGMLLNTMPSGFDVHFTADSSTVAIGSGNVVNLYHVPDGKLIQTITTSTGNLNSFSISPDGALVATGTTDGHLSIWNGATGSLIKSWAGQVGRVDSLDFAPDGKRLVSGSGRSSQTVDNSFRIWNVTDNSQLVGISNPNLTGNYFGDNYYKVKFSSDGGKIVVAVLHDKRDVFVYDASNGALLSSFSTGSFGTVNAPSDNLNTVAISQDIQTVAICSPYHTVDLRYIATGQEFQRISLGNVGCSSANFAPGGQNVIVGGGDVGDAGPGVSIWRISDGVELQELTRPGAAGTIGVLSVSPDGKFVAAKSLFHGAITIQRASDGSVVTVLGLGQSNSNTATFSPDGSLIAFQYDKYNSRESNYDAYVSLLRTTDWSVVQTFSAQDTNWDMTFSPDGRYLYCGNGEVHRVADGVLAATVPVEFGSFSPDSSQLVIAQGDSNSQWHGLLFYRVSDWQNVRSLQIIGNPQMAIVSPDGQSIAVLMGNNEIGLYRYSDGTFLNSIPPFDNSTPATLAFSPDSQVLAVGDSAYHLALWSVTDGSLLTNYTTETGAEVGGGLRSGVRRVAYSADGKFLYYGRSDGTVCCALNPYRNAIFPNHGGNTGNVTVKIVTALDFPLSSGATVKLTADGQPDIIPTSIMVDNNYDMNAVFALDSAPSGVRNVVITNADGTTRTYPQGFKIEPGTSPQVQVQINALSAIHIGNTKALFINVTNIGNTDAYAIPTWLSVTPVSTALSANFEFTVPPLVNGETTPVWTDFPSIFSTPTRTLAPFLLPLLSAGSSQWLTYTITPTEDGVTNIGAWVNPIYHNTSLTGFIINAEENIKDALKDIYFKALGNNLLPDDPCLQQAFQNFQDAVSMLVTMQPNVNSRITSLVDLYVAALKTLLKCKGEQLGDKELNQAIEAIMDKFDKLDEFIDCLDQEDPEGSTTVSVSSYDPNDLVGSKGFGVQAWKSVSLPLSYTIFFANDATATAPAQQIIITNHLDAVNLDMTTIQLNSISFADQTVTPSLKTSPPVGQRQFNADVDLRPNKELIVHINASVDLLTGDLTWTLTSLDPVTGLPTTDPLLGLLDPGQEGSVLFSITPKNTVPTGTLIYDQATVVFDVNAPINTPTWFNTIDNDKPVSAVSPLPAQVHALSFPVSWMGGDVGSGLRDYTIYVSDNGGPFTPWLTNTTNTNATYTGQSGHTYAFYSKARDNAYNIEDAHTQSDALTTTPNIIDVSSLMQISSSGLVYNRATKLFSGTLTLKNISQQSISGPLQAVLNNLTAGVTLANASGTSNGAPYLTANIATLAPGATATLTVQFSNPNNAKIGYSITTYSGTF
jgi:hypothetical protein